MLKFADLDNNLLNQLLDYVDNNDVESVFGFLKNFSLSADFSKIADILRTYAQESGNTFMSNQLDMIENAPYRAAKRLRRPFRRFRAQELEPEVDEQSEEEKQRILEEFGKPYDNRAIEIQTESGIDENHYLFTRDQKYLFQAEKMLETIESDIEHGMYQKVLKGLENMQDRFQDVFEGSVMFLIGLVNDNYADKQFGITFRQPDPEKIEIEKQSILEHIEILSS